MLDAGFFEHSSVLVKKSYRMASRGLSTGMHATVENLRSALERVQKPEREIHGGIADASVTR